MTRGIAVVAALVPALLFAWGCASSDESRDHPKENLKPVGDREPINYAEVDFGKLEDRVRFFADLDQKMKLWEQARSRNVHGIVQPTERSLKEIVRGNFDQLVRTAQDGIPNERAIAAMALGFSADSRAVAPLMGLLHEPDPVFRTNALTSLGALHDPETPVEPVIALLADTDAGVRAAAAYCLGQIVPPWSDKGALVPLMQATTDPDKAVRQNSVASLALLGNHMATRTIVSNSLFDENWEIRYSACAALGRIKDKRAVIPLIDRLNDEDANVRLMAEEALHEITGEDFGKNDKAWRAWAQERRAELE